MPDMKLIAEILPLLTEAERAELDLLLTADGRRWHPLPGPQQAARESLADVVGYGGAAGGGKTDLAVGLALEDHTKALIVREHGTEMTAIVDRVAELLGGRDGYNGQERIWRLPGAPGKQIEFASIPNPGDETKTQGRPRDLLVVDEAANCREHQVRFMMGWVRSTKPGQRTRVLLTFNPPTTDEGRWIVRFFAPWLDPLHTNPARPGELRYFATIEGENDVEVADGRPFVLVGGERVYNFDPAKFDRVDIITPQSRTFIPARVTDNPYMNAGYVSTLQAMPEPLRSQMLKGDFSAGMEDDPWQVIPTAWVDAAMSRWEPRASKGRMDSMGVDVARGGKDKTVIARRHGRWFDAPLEYPGTETPEGNITAGLVISARRDRSPVHIDIVGWGSEAYAYLKTNNVQVVGMNGAEGAQGVSVAGGLSFRNRRTELYWRMREALDPNNPEPIALPPIPLLRSELCAPKWKLSGGKIAVESKEELIERIGHSPNHSDAYIMALEETLRDEDFAALVANTKGRREYDPYAYSPKTSRQGYNPYNTRR